jgi:hypothetical protein
MTTNGYFGPGLFRFLRDLKTHNERRWFEANKQRYKADVQAPFLRLITDLAPALKEIGGGFIGDPSPHGGSMMRIYRDIRGSDRLSLDDAIAVGLIADHPLRCGDRSTAVDQGSSTSPVPLRHRIHARGEAL